MANEGPGRGMDITHGCCMMLVWFSGANAGERLSLCWGHRCPGAGTSPAPHILFGDLPGPPASQPQPPPLPPRAGTCGELLPPQPLPILPFFTAPPSHTRPWLISQPHAPQLSPRGDTWPCSRPPAAAVRADPRGARSPDECRLLSSKPNFLAGLRESRGAPPLLLPSRGERSEPVFLNWFNLFSGADVKHFVIGDNSTFF